MIKRVGILASGSLIATELVERLSEERPDLELVQMGSAPDVAVLSGSGGDFHVSLPLSVEGVEQSDVLFCCEKPDEDTRELISKASGRIAVVDLTGTLDSKIVDAGKGDRVSTLGAGSFVCPSAGALLTARLVEAAQAAGAKGMAVATVLEPVSEVSREALDELHAQAKSLLSFGASSMPEEVLGGRAVFEVLSPGVDGAFREARLARELSALLGRPDAVSALLLQPGTFHGVAVTMRAQVDAGAWRAELEKVEGLEWEEGKSSTGPAARAIDHDMKISRLVSDGQGGAWVFAAADSFAHGAVGAAVQLLAR